MTHGRDQRYADMADRMGDDHLRDVQVRSSQERARHATRFQVSDGLHPMTQGWAKYHPNEATVEVIDLDGKRRYITPTQHSVLLAARSLRDAASMRTIAASLGVATSTVSRALLRLASLGLVAYDVVRGRYGGVSIVRATGRELRDRAQAAWSRLRHARMKQEGRWYDRLSRSGYPLAFNVASYMDRDATLKPWTAADMAEVDMARP
jgi:DNA-binding MarR family transcriptional regulator